MKQREADARLLGQREALRAQRAAELADAEAQARARAVEFEGPVMRALTQDKVRAQDAGDWPLPRATALPCRLSDTQAVAARECHTMPGHYRYQSQQNWPKGWSQGSMPFSQYNDPRHACCRSAHGSWQTEAQRPGTTRTCPQRKRAGRGTSSTRRRRRRRQRRPPNQAAAASAPQRARREAQPVERGHIAVGRRLQARRSRRLPQMRQRSQQPRARKACSYAVTLLQLSQQSHVA